ncbi:MAG TPA: helix-turn-helix domain-containing protein [Methylococcaceae bacterium]|jgi:Fis family transcriptional regulator|nr:helix-turn-helix domain-containing protein [Methylococcaceae bacterium]
MRVNAKAISSDDARQDTQALLLSEHVRLVVGDYFSRLDGHPVNELYAMVLSEVERPLIQTVLEHCGHNQSKAAQILGLSRSTLRKKMSQYGLE